MGSPVGEHLVSPSGQKEATHKTPSLESPIALVSHCCSSSKLCTDSKVGVAFPWGGGAGLAYGDSQTRGLMDSWVGEKA